MALGFAFAALVMFVGWNLMPVYQTNVESFQELVRSGWFFQYLWPEVFDPNVYIEAFYSPSIKQFIDVFLSLSYLMNAFTVLLLVPFWKYFHQSCGIRVFIFLPNFLGAMIKMKYAIQWHCIADQLPVIIYPYHQTADYLAISSMLAVSGAVSIFKNELGLRRELELVKNLNSKL